MSRWTTELRHLKRTGTKIFPDHYPMVAGHREAFEEKFYKHFKYREIGFSTVEEFQDKLEARLLDFSPTYMQRYLSEGLIKNPLITDYMVECFTRKNDRRTLENAVKTAQTASESESRNAAIADGTSATKGTLVGEGNSHEEQSIDTTEKVTSHTEHEGKGTKGSTKKSEGTNNFTETTDGTKNWEESDAVDTTKDTTSDGTESVAFYDTPQSQSLPPQASQITTLTNTTTHGDVKEVGHSEGSKNHAETVTSNLDHKGDTSALENYDEDTTNDWTEDSEKDTIGKTDKVTDGNTTKSENTTGDQVTHGTSSGTENSEARLSTVGSETSDQSRKDITDFSRTEQGRKGISEMELIEEFRKTFLNVDLEIIMYCEPLFLGVYNYER